MSEITYTCPECSTALELLMDEDSDRPEDDRWTCMQCNIAYSHVEFPLPPGYVAQARAWEKEARRAEAEKDDRAALAAWNKWARRQG